MTINSDTRKAGPYLGDGTTVTLPFGFKVFQASDLRVVRTDSAGVESELVLGSDYTAVLNANQDTTPGGSITLVTPAATGTRTTIGSSIAALQKIQLANNGGFYAEVLNGGLDRLTILIQQLIEEQSRSLRVPFSDIAGGTEMANSVSRANKVLGFDSSGRPAYTVPTSGSAADVALQLASLITDLASTTSGKGQDLVYFPKVAAETTAGATIVRPQYEPGNVLRYGADRTGATSSQTAFDTAKAVSKAGLGFIYAPWGDFKVNLLFTDSEGDYCWFRTDGFRTRLLPLSSASPVVDLYATTGGNGITGFRFESCLIDSSLSGSTTHVGIGVRLRASNPGFIWKSKFGHLYIRGFGTKGFQVDCDINIGEIFDNDFDQIEVLDVSGDSVDMKGIYNRVGRIFVTESGARAVIFNGSACVVDQVVTDGPVSFGASGCRVGLVVVEGTNGVGATTCVDFSGPNYYVGSILLKDVPAAKYTYGVAFSGASTGLSIESIVVTGATYPGTPVLLNAGSAGSVGSMSIPGGTKISTSTAVTQNWRFLGDVSSAFNGDRYLDPNLFIEYSTGRLNSLGGTRRKRLAVTYSASMTFDSATAEHFVITATNTTAFTINAPLNPVDGATFELTIANTSGGALGAITWNPVFKMAAWTSPATGNGRSIRFRYDGTNWREVSRTPSDVPN